MKAFYGIGRALALLLVSGVALSAGCAGDLTSGPETPPVASQEEVPADRQVHLLLTDFPIGDANVQKVLVTFTHVEVYSEEHQAWLTVADYGQAGREFDLLTLQDGATAELAVFTLAPGTYAQMRLHLKGDNAIEVDEGQGPVRLPLKVPSGTQTGIKLVHPFTVTGQGPTQLIVDFDAEKSVKRTGHGWQLQPTLKVLDAVAAQASLLIQVLDEQAQPIPGAAISTQGAMFSTDGSGQLLLRGLPAGVLQARVDAPGFTSAAFLQEIAEGLRSHRQITLYSLGEPIRFQAHHGVTVEGGDVRVSIPPDSVVDALGRPITGTVELTLIPHGSTPGLPSPLAGISSSEQMVELESLFAADISLWQQGAPAQLAPQKTARVEFLVPEAIAGHYQPGDTVPAWWLDLDGAVWREQAGGTIQASTSQPHRLVWVAEVPHFSKWMAATGETPWLCGERNPTVHCQPGYECILSSCRSLAREGRPCGNPLYPNCVSGLLCIGGTCRSPGDVGTPCASDAGCRWGYYCRFNSCWPPAEEGASCGGAYPPCARDYACMNGICRNPITCSASISSTTIPSGGTATFSFVTSGPVPAGSRSYLHGTRNGVVDADGSPSYDQTTLSYLVLNSPGLEGFYERYVVIRGPDSAPLCTTNTVSAQFLP